MVNNTYNKHANFILDITRIITLKLLYLRNQRDIIKTLHETKKLYVPGKPFRLPSTFFDSKTLLDFLNI